MGLFAKFEGISLNNLKLHVNSIITDIKEGRFKKRRWHLHALALPLVLLVNLLMFHAEAIQATHWFMVIFRSLHETGIVGRFLIQTILAIIISYSVEIFQGIFFGANRTKAEVFESNKDALFTIFCFEIGIIIGLIFL